MISGRGLHKQSDVRVCEGDKSLFVLERKLIMWNWLSSISFGLSESLDGTPVWTVGPWKHARSHWLIGGGKLESLSHSFTLHLQESSLEIWEGLASHHNFYTFLKETCICLSHLKKTLPKKRMGSLRVALIAHELIDSCNHDHWFVYL